MGLGVGLVFVGTVRGLILHGRFDRRWALIGVATFSLGLALGIIDALMRDKPLW